jgi:membrane protein DedA with SNARE-associated domain
VFLDLTLGVLGGLHGSSVHTLLFLLVAGAGIGGPWSQDILLLAAGTVIAPQDLSPPLAMAAAWAGVMAGDAFSLWMGHHYGARWVRRPWAARFVPPERLPGLEEGLRRIAAPFAFVTRWLPGQRGTLFFIAGTLRLRWLPFLLGDGIAAGVQVPLLFIGVRSLGWSWQSLQAGFERADDLLTLALVIVLLAWWLWARSAARKLS